MIRCCCFFGFFLLLSEEQTWAENYTVQHCPAVPGSYPAAAEIHPQPMADKPPQYEGTWHENSTPSLKHSISNNLLFCGTVNPPQTIPSPVQPDVCDLEISIHYRKTEMLKTTVRAPRLQLHYHNEVPELQAHHHICFPPTDGLLDRKQVDLRLSCCHQRCDL